MGKVAAADAPGTPASAAGGGDEHADPWFTPESESESRSEGDVSQAGNGGQAEWFLPAGRAGLLPESMTVCWDEDEPSEDRAARAGAAGAPPWAGDAETPAASEPPPWENGPWPGPGERGADRPGAPPVGDQPEQPTSTGGEPYGAARRVPRRLLLAAGAAAAVVVVITVVIVASASGGSGTGCTTYPAAVRHAYTTAMSDLSSRAPAATQAADLGRAASVANVSAASAGQMSARTAMFALASDLDEAHSDVIAHRPVPPALMQRLTADGTALPSSCPG